MTKTASDNHPGRLLRAARIEQGLTLRALATWAVRRRNEFGLPAGPTHPSH